MKKNGFTVVEVIVSFVLVTTISVFLFQLVLLLRNLYNNSDVKTELLNKQATLTNLLYEYLDKDITAIGKYNAGCSGCTLTGIYFDYADGNRNSLLIETKPENKYIELKNDNSTFLYKTILSEGTEFGQVSFDIITVNDKKILKIKVEILNEKFENKDFGLNIIYQFKDGEITLKSF